MIQIKLAGTISSAPKFSHKAFGENFYEFYVDVERLSGTVDHIPCMIPEIYLNEIPEERIYISGDIRTHMMANDEKKVAIYVFTRNVSEWHCEDLNEVTGWGYISRVSEARETPETAMLITDFVITSIVSKMGKKAYIPSIAWNRNAIRVAEMTKRGDVVEVQGRLQSREYLKVLDSGEEEIRTAYELSVSTLEIMEDAV